MTCAMDTSIVFDILSVKLMDELLSMDCTFRTTSFVMSELDNSEVRCFLQRISAARNFEIADLDNSDFQTYPTLPDIEISIADRSVVALARKLQCPVLTGDRNFKAALTHSGIKAFDVLEILESLIRKNVLSTSDACKKLTSLMRIDRTLPKEACQERLRAWRGK